MPQSDPIPFQTASERANVTSATNIREFAAAMSALQSGRLDEAERLLTLTLRVQPTHLAALNLLGVVLGRLGRNAEAIASFDRALATAADSDEAWYGRGMTLLAMNRPAQALKSFERVIALKPDLSQVRLLRARLLVDLDRHDAALETIDDLIAKFPTLAEAWLGRSNVLFSVARYSEALSSAERALALKPDFADAWQARGNALHELKRHNEALVAFDKAVALHPDFTGAWHGRGNALYELKLHDEALVAYDKALALAPDLTEAWLGRGYALIELRRNREALSAFDRAEAYMPNLVEAWLGRGSAFYALNRYGEALAAYSKALTLKPNLPEALRNCGNAYVQLKELDKALRAYDRALAIKPDFKLTKGGRLHVKLQLSDWTNLNAEISDVIASVRAHETPIAPFEFLAVSSSPADQLLCAKQNIADYRSFPAASRRETYAHERLRIGYFSADLRNHPVGQLAVGLFEAHDKSHFETIALSFGPDDGSDLRRRIKSAVEHFIDAENMSDADLAALIRRREINMLIDLTGFTMHSRFSVLARRAAPIQVNFLGYSGTMGADCVDYIIADRTVIPEDHFRFYSEQVVWLPDTFQPNDSKRSITERKPSRSECGLPESGFIFCCFNNTYKITPEVFAVWMRLLARTEGSVLWLAETNSTATQNLRREAKARGISPERLIFAPKMPLAADHLARHRQADLFLDTLPYNAHTTASDALWAGLPVLTYLGETFAGRVAASLLKAIGVPELITTSLEDYEALALRLARDPALLGTIKDKLLRNRDTSPLFDTARFTRHLEAAYSTMWHRYQSGGEPPRAFAVESVVT
jgi:protein O-GlcNAc transferase